MIDLEYNYLRQRLRIGNQLIDGPNSIWPPDNNGWLEKDVEITFNQNNFQSVEGLSIWSDSSMNKSEDFYKPIIRHVRWDKTIDREKHAKKSTDTWPSSEVYLGYIKAEKFDSLNSLIIDIQVSLKDIVFPPLGISLARDSTEVDEEGNYSKYYHFYIRNGVQSFELNSPPIKSDLFTQKIYMLFDLLKASVAHFDKKGWKEKYDNKFLTPEFKWDYQPIDSGLENPV